MYRLCQSSSPAGVSARALLAVSAVLLLWMAMAATVVRASPGVGPTAAVSMGDSYISGEAGRWQGNSVNPAPGHDGTDRACTPSGPACQVDKSKVYVGGSAADGCHRSDTAEILSAALAVASRINIACSGAVTKNLYRASSGGVGQNGEPAQADQLLTVARTNDVKLIMVSIGGNDLGFASIVGTCFTNYEARRGPCEPQEQPAIEAAIPAAAAAVEKAIDEIRAVMSEDGYGSSDYRLVLQTYPSVVPRASQTRYSENDPQRTADGCPFYDQDLTWARTQAAPEIGSMVKIAAAARGVETMDLIDALQGHEICSTTDAAVTPTVPPSPVTSEWGRVLSGSTVQQGDLQEAFHPNSFAQRAFGRCLTQLFVQAPGLFTCTGAAGIGPQGMVLTRTGSLSAPTQGPGSPSVAAAPTKAGPAAPGGRRAGRCLSRRAFAVHVRRRYRGRLLSARVFIGPRSVASIRSGPRGARISLRGRPAGAVVVRIVMRLRGGHTATDRRRYRLCA